MHSKLSEDLGESSQTFLRHVKGPLKLLKTIRPERRPGFIGRVQVVYDPAPSEDKLNLERTLQHHAHLDLTHLEFLNDHKWELLLSVESSTNLYDRQRLRPPTDSSP